MKTRPAIRELGTWLVVEGSEVKKQEAVACDAGTTISVKNLFYNIPARRNFLKSNPVEMKHIVDEFQRIALARPDLSFSLIQGDEVVYDLPATKLSQRIIGLFGKSYQQQLAACKEETDLVAVAGYIGKPESARKTRGEQFLFVNKRFIRNNYLNHAVTSAYENLLPEGSFPFYVLFLEIDPKHIDVNVHPTKTEIKFDDERAVYAVVRAAVRQALGAHNLTPALDYSADVNLTSKIGSTLALSREQYLEEQLGTSLQRSNLQHWERLFDEERPTQSRLFPTEPATITRSSAMNEKTPEPEEKSLFQLDNQYVVRPVRNGIMIIDQEAAHQRILFEQFVQRMQQKSGASIPGLFPQTITMSASDFALVMEMELEIKSLGFQFEIFGKQSIVVNAIPAEATGMSEKDLFEGLMEQFKHNQSNLSLPLQDNLASALAKRASIKKGQRLGREEMQALVAGLMACRNPNYSPDGNTTFFIFETSKVESHFR
jgi:DNA mismatch repair protein MutL